MTETVIFLVVLALFFDFLNGFHDSANSIATIVSTRVLTPRKAVVWAAMFNFIAILIGNFAVAKTMGKGIIDVNIVDNNIIFGALAGACLWNLITWYFGLPTSSSHALIGGMIGAALMKVGSQGLVWSGIMKTVAFIVISPMMGLVIGMSIGVIVFWSFRKFAPRRVDTIFRKGQLVSAALYSLGHGSNDAQKTMGIITSLLFSAGLQSGEFKPLPWVILASQSAIAVGTLFGGWRIVKTMGQKVAKLKPVDGFCAETGAAVSLGIATLMAGAPVSTTHTITGAIMGVGSLRRMSAVRWGVAGRIIWAWILTIPISAGISALAYTVFKYFHQ